MLVVERGGVRRPWGGQKTVAIPVGDIAGVDVRANPVQWNVVLRTRSGATYGFALPVISRGAARFVTSLRGAVAGGNEA